MSIFVYDALDVQGRRVRGQVVATGKRAARERLKREGLYPIELAEDEGVARRRGRRPRRGAQRALLLRQLAALLKAGFPLVRALEAMADQEEDDETRHRLEAMQELLREGATLEDAARAQEDLFGPLLPPVARVGEQSSTLPRLVDRLAHAAERQHALAEKLLSALIYPLLMAIMAVTVTLFLLVVVVPTTSRVFAQVGADLPWITRIVVGLSEVLRSPGGLLAGGLALLGGGWLAASPARRGRLWRRLAPYLMRIGRVRELIGLADGARWARAMSALQPSGVPVAEALETARLAVRSPLLRRQLAPVTGALREGRRLADALEGVDFPPLLRHMVRLGEESGRLGELLGAAADMFEGRFEQRLGLLVALLEPLTIVIMGVVVALLATAMILPLYDLTGALSHAYH